MLLHCDFVIAEEGSRFSLPFVDFGLVPEAASSLLLPRLAGRRAAARYLLLGEPSESKKRCRSGLSAIACAAGTLDATLSEIIGRLACQAARSAAARRNGYCATERATRFWNGCAWKAAFLPSG